MAWPTALELLANLSYLISVLLAAYNRSSTWVVGILGSVLFGVLFYQSQLYADVTLQLFFVVTSALGLWHWSKGNRGNAAPISTTSVAQLAGMAAVAVLVATAYGSLLHRFTDAYAPFVDSLVLTLSVVAQLMLMRRKLETWWFWLAVNTLSVPLFASRGLYLTAGVYGVFWLNAWWGWYRWRLAHRGLVGPVSAAVA